MYMFAAMAARIKVRKLATAAATVAVGTMPMARNNSTNRQVWTAHGMSQCVATAAVAAACAPSTRASAAAALLRGAPTVSALAAR